MSFNVYIYKSYELNKRYNYCSLTTNLAVDCQERTIDTDIAATDLLILCSRQTTKLLSLLELLFKTLLFFTLLLYPLDLQ